MEAEDAEPPTFWAFEIPAGGVLTQRVPPTASVCLTNATLVSASSKRVVLAASSGGVTAVICNLFGTSGHDRANLGQPFHTDFQLRVTGSATVHVTGFARGELGAPATVTAGGGKSSAGVKAKASAPAASSGGRGGVQDEGDDEDDDDDDEDGEEEDEDDEEDDGEEESEDDDDDDEEGEEDDEEDDEDDDEEEEDDEEEDEEGDMPLAPPSLEALLRGSAAKTKGRPAEAAPAAPASARVAKDGAAPGTKRVAEQPPGGDVRAPAAKASKSAAGASAPAKAAAPAAPGGSAPVDPSVAFQPSAKFAGARPGFVFKRGAKGVGYYRDAVDTLRPNKPGLPAANAKGAAAAGGASSSFRTKGGVEVTEERAGGGATAVYGKNVTVKYAGTLTSGKRFDAGTIGFRLGAGEVIPGWDQGVKGMKVGGKRRLKIPPQMGYGARGAPPTIPPNATLLFEVELKNCQ